MSQPLKWLQWGLCVTVLCALYLHAHTTMFAGHVLPARLKYYQHLHLPPMPTDDLWLSKLCQVYGVRAVYERTPVEHVSEWCAQAPISEWWATQTTFEGTWVIFRPCPLKIIPPPLGTWRIWSVVWQETSRNRAALQVAWKKLRSRCLRMQKRSR